ncbi:hypothetical protein DDZ13_02570 [Coraliomargarita sinensis]|uniref:Uncharacterized protein n=1 Tax=Coraliomargarita sinensis TaxID=2174842 RepID=A0A317ZH01_9BACT|nr:hypothetical protein [Coraliomargarita sinensis]PXA04866.1 hypothetical protein DDZ13_02570 [Coraliomargarita sinensis]
MDSPDEKKLDQVASLFLRLGADRSQADLMARQLLKRAKQIADEREITELEALENLLKQVIEARQGS